MNLLFELLAILVSLGGLPAVFAMGWRPCGCKCCYLDDTEFGGSKPSDWTEVSGTWAYGSGYATTEDSDVILINDNSITPTKYGIFAVAHSHTAGDEMRIIFNYLDSSNYHYVQITNGGSGEISIVKVTSGTPSTLNSESSNAFPVGTDIYINLCVNGSWVGVNTYEIGFGGRTWLQGVQYTSYSAHASGDQAGVGTGTTSSVPPDDPSTSFGDFKIDETSASKEVCHVCAECGQHEDQKSPYKDFCCNDGKPDTVEVTLNDDWTEGDCDNCDLSGVYTLSLASSLTHGCLGTFQRRSSCEYTYFDDPFCSEASSDVTLRINAYVDFVGNQCVWTVTIQLDDKALPFSNPSYHQWVFASSPFSTTACDGVSFTLTYVREDTCTNDSGNSSCDITGSPSDITLEPAL